MPTAVIIRLLLRMMTPGPTLMSRPVRLFGAVPEKRAPLHLFSTRPETSSSPTPELPEGVTDERSCYHI